MSSITRFIRDLFGNISRQLRLFKRSRTGKVTIIVTATLGVIGPLLFTGGSTAALLLHPALNPIRDPVSSLVFGKFGRLQTSAFLAFGCSMMAMAVTLFLKVKSRINAGAVVVAFIGIAFVLLGFNDAPLAGIQTTLQNIVHQYSATSIVMMSPLACFLLAPVLKKNGFSSLQLYSIAAGIFALLFITVGGFILVQRMSLVGIFERVLLLNGQLWAEIICIVLIWRIFGNKLTPSLSVTKEKSNNS
jgi:hypothetical protein